jgi:hypothetical protein
MKSPRLAFVLLGLAMLVFAFFWMFSSSKTQGIVSGREGEPVSTVVPAPVMHANDLILVEFFAGY